MPTSGKCANVVERWGRPIDRARFVLRPLSYPLFLLLALLGAMPGCSRCDRAGAGGWVARIDELQGEVVVLEPGTKHGTAAAKGQLLQLASRLETGKDGSAKLSLRGGGTLRVDPDSIVLLQGSDLGARAAGGQEMTLLLEQGQIVGTGATLEASMMVIEVGGQRIRIGRSAEARVTVPVADDKLPRMFMVLGSATVIDATGARREVVQGDLLEIGAAKVAEPRDAGIPEGVPDAASVTVIEAKDLVYHLKLERGRGLVRGPGDSRFRRIDRRRPVPIQLGTAIKLADRSVATVENEEGASSELRGPAELVVREGKDRDDGRPTLEFETRSEEQTITLRGKRGDAGPPYVVQGVRMSTFITHRQLNVRIKQEDKRALVSVRNGEVRFAGKKGQSTRVEAGQQAIVTGGQVTGPKQPPDASLVIDKPGSLRVFVASLKVPVTWTWTRPDGTPGALVEVATSPSFKNPLFADVVERQSLTLEVPRSTLYWRVRPLGKDGTFGQPTEGRLALVRDTSFLALKDVRPPRNVIHESFGNTTVFYQNALPSFTFSWKPITGASQYTFKLFREGNVSEPLRAAETRATSVTMPSGRVGEGSYLWYVAARDSAGELVQTTKSRRLGIRYDNATPNLQIIYPRSGLAVSEDRIEVRGAAIPGSSVFINGQAVTLDDTHRFVHAVSLKPGLNDIIFRVVDKRSGSSLYLRRVVRKGGP